MPEGVPYEFHAPPLLICTCTSYYTSFLRNLPVRKPPPVRLTFSTTLSPLSFMVILSHQAGHLQKCQTHNYNVHHAYSMYMYVCMYVCTFPPPPTCRHITLKTFPNIKMRAGRQQVHRRFKTARSLTQFLLQ